MPLQKYLLIVLSVFMQFMPIGAKNEIHKFDMQNQIEEYNDEKSEENNSYSVNEHYETCNDVQVAH